MNDLIVLANLHQRGFDFSDTQELLRYEAVERRKRVLDEAPRRLTFKVVKEVVPFGTREQFTATYNEVLGSLDSGPFTVEIQTLPIVLEKPIYAILQTLITTSITSNALLSDACSKLFQTIVMQKGERTCINTYNTLAGIKFDSYYEKTLKSAILDIIEPGYSVVTEWLELVNMQTGMYKLAIELGKKHILDNKWTSQEMNKNISEAYKEAKVDKEFMANVYKQVANKWLIGMLYILRDNNKVLEPGDSSDGFLNT